MLCYNVTDQGKLMEEDQRLRQAVAKGLTDLPKKVPKERMPNTYPKP